MKRIAKEFAAMIVGLIFAAPVIYVGANVAWQFNGTWMALAVALLASGVSAAILIGALSAAGRYTR